MPTIQASMSLLVIQSLIAGHPCRTWARTVQCGHRGGPSISEATAKTHVSRVLARLGLTSRVQAAIVAKEAGLA